MTTLDHPERSPEEQPLLGSTSSRRAQLLWLSLGGSRMAFSGKKSVKTPGNDWRFFRWRVGSGWNQWLDETSIGAYISPIS